MGNFIEWKAAEQKRTSVPVHSSGFKEMSFLTFSLRIIAWIASYRDQFFSHLTCLVKLLHALIHFDVQV